MKLSRAMLLATFIVLSAGWAHATVTDPTIIIRGGVYNNSSTPIFGTTFSITSSSGTSPGTSPCVLNGSVVVANCLFSNESGSNWFNLVFNVPAGQSGLSCQALDFFTNCSFNAAGTMVTFSGGIGIPTNDYDDDEVSFTVEVDNWPSNSNFSAVANVPEPPTMALVLSAVGALVAWRRLRSGSSSRA